MIILFCMLAAGGLGAVARWLTDGLLTRAHRGVFPWATAAINIAGSLALGLVGGLTLAQHQGLAWESVVGTGLLGGFTTFSTASVESVRLLGRGHRAMAAAYVFGLALVCVGVCAGGWVIAAVV